MKKIYIVQYFDGGDRYDNIIAYRKKKDADSFTLKCRELKAKYEEELSESGYYDIDDYSEKMRFRYNFLENFKNKIGDEHTIKGFEFAYSLSIEELELF